MKCLLSLLLLSVSLLSLFDGCSVGYSSGHTSINFLKKFHLGPNRCTFNFIYKLLPGLFTFMPNLTFLCLIPGGKTFLEKRMNHANRDIFAKRLEKTMLTD